MKICSMCKLPKDESEFFKHSKTKDGLYSNCKDCKRASAMRSYYASNNRKTKTVERAAQNARSNRLFVNRYKRFCVCIFCGEKEPIALDLHHKDPSSKDDNVAKIVKNSRQRVKDEIRKCVVICANCHRKLHAGLKGFSLHG